MRLIKIEESPEKEKGETPTQVSFASMKAAEASALRDHNVGKDVTKGVAATEELIQSQYINIQRVPDGVNKNFLGSGSLLPGNELLVDMNGDLISGGTVPLDRYMPQQYEDDLLHDDLTEDDKRLAAALVAVQLVNQQKQQAGSHMLPLLPSAKLATAEPLAAMPPLTGPNKTLPAPSVTVAGSVACDKSSGMVHMVSSYIQAVEDEGSVSESPGQAAVQPVQPLPPLKKVLSRNRYMRPHLTQLVQSEETQHQAQQAHQAQLASLGIHTETDAIEIAAEEMEVGHSEVIKSELSDFINIHEDVAVAVAVAIKTEAELATDEEPDSDPAAGSEEEDNRRNSLPHKKRIPRKLKHPKKSSLGRTLGRTLGRGLGACPECPELLASPAAFAAHKASHAAKRTFPLTAPSTFACELCFKTFTNQWKFFEHLKSHYEPIEVEPPPPKRPPAPQAKVAATGPGEGGKKPAEKGPVVKLRGHGAHGAHGTHAAHGAAHGAHGAQGVAARTTQGKGKVSGSGGAGPGTKWVPTAHLQEVTITPTSILQQTLTQHHSGHGVHSGHSAVQAVEQTLWECEPCKRIFRRQKTFETHMSVAHPKQEDIEEFSDPEDMMEGIRVQVHSDDDREPVDSGSREASREWYGEEELHAAEADLRDLEEHTKTVYVDGHVCEMCSEAYESKAHLNQHIQQAHAELMSAITKTVRRAPDGMAKKGNLSCKQCGRLFHHRNSLMYHLKSHLGQRPHQCEVCGKGFFATSALKVHMRQHSGVKPFKCEFCGRSFRQWGDLKYHCISIHSDQKNFQCEYCGKDFARKYSLTVHSRIHTGERNYKCEFCEKSFRASTYLQNHRRIHTGEKPHPCSVCGKPFRVRSDMKRHMITHSKEYSTYLHVKTKAEPESDSPSPPQTKIVVQVDQQMSKVEELEVSTVESILPDTDSGARLAEDMGVAYTARDPLEPKTEPGTLYVWPVYMT